MSLKERVSTFWQKLKTRRDVQVWWFFWFILAIFWLVYFGIGIRISSITAQFPVMDKTLINAPNLTFPSFCLHAFEQGANFIADPSQPGLCYQTSYSGVQSGQKTNLPGKTYTTGCPASPDRATSSCICFNNYPSFGGSDPLTIGTPDKMAPIECSFKLTNGSSLLWICDPNPDGSCGTRFSNPFGANARAIPVGFRTFVGLEAAFVHNINGTWNSTDYITHVSPVILPPIGFSSPINTLMAMNFLSYSVFHYFPVDEFNSFRFIMFMSSWTFFSMCIHRLAFLIVASIFFRKTTLELGWGPRDQGSSEATYSNVY